MQTTLKVAIQGDRASFHEIAAYALYKQPIKLIYCASFEDVFDKLATHTVDKVLVATSNSSHGVIEEVAQLINKYAVMYEHEYHLPIEQHLIGLPHTDITSLQAVISHPVALSQCSKFIKELDGIVKTPHHDTAAAVEYVKSTNDSAIAAIGSSAAANLHGLTILRHSIQNDPNNVTIFKSYSLKRL